MILDAYNLYSDEQAVTAAAESTNILDHEEPRDMGVGERLYIFCVVDVAMTDGGSDSTVEVKLQTDDNESFSSPTDGQVLFTFPATSPVGTRRYVAIAPDALNERYSRLYFTPANGNLTTGSFTAGIVKDIDKVNFYADGITISK